MTTQGETPNEVTERKTMETVRDFLRESGLSTSVQWLRHNSNDFPDYWTKVGGQQWAFEITRLWELPRMAYKRRPTARNVAEIKSSLNTYRVPTDAGTLQDVLKKAFSDKSEPKKLALLNGASYCLIIVNGQFDDLDAWVGMDSQFNLSAFHSVIIAHFPVSDPKNKLICPSDLQPVCEVWKNGFGTELPKHTIGELFPS